jgi:hypothetical protein
MTNNYKNKNGGLIKMIIVIIIAIAILSYYGFDIKNFFTSPQAQKNFGYVWNFITDAWTNYLAEPASKVWGIWIQYIWSPLMTVITKK